MTTEERLEKLERELSRARRHNRWLLAGAALCLGIGGLVWAFGPDTVVAQLDATTPNEVRASRLVIEDEDGTTRALLEATKGGTTLRLSDENGTLRIGLGAFGDGPALGLYDERGTVIWSAP